MLSEIFMQINRILTKLCQLKLGSPVIMPHHVLPHQIIIQSWYTGRWRVGCYIWYSEEGPGRAAAMPSPLLAVPNVHWPH